MYASKSKRGFYHPDIHSPMPEDAVEISDELYRALRDGESSGKVIVWGDIPELRDASPMTREHVEALRLRAYADPLTGSDRYIAEAASERIFGNEPAAAEAEKKHISRRAEIAARYPWPEGE